MSRLSVDAVPRLRPETRYRMVGGQAVVIVQDAGEALVLNEVGSRILELVDGERSVSAIAAELLAEYEVTADELESDVRELVADLEAAGVVETGAET